MFPAGAAPAVPAIDAAPAAERRLGRRATWAAAGLTAPIAAAYVFLFTHRFGDRVYAWRRIVRVDIPWAPLSAALAVAGLFVALRYALADDRLLSLGRLRAAVDWRRAALAAGLALAARLAAGALGAGTKVAFTVAGFAAYSLVTAAADPLLFVVAHIVYFGPAVALLILLWPAFCRSLDGYGLGLRLSVVATTVLALNSQSRQQINLLPIVVVPLAALLDRRGLSRRAVAAIVVLSVACSKVWYTFNTGPQVDDNTPQALLGFPLQHYFMSSGPWMSRDMYFVQGALATVVAAVCYAAVVRLTRPGAAAGKARALAV
jgi:hypothetical protein